MKILLLHNRYRQRGGEDTVFELEVSVLRQAGHEVLEYVDTNDALEESRPLSAFLQTVWSRRSQRAIEDLLRAEKPDVAHFHNTFARISPAAYRTCAERGVAVVQTLHNFRLVCPAATFRRDGRVCEDCVGFTPPWPAVWHACYRGSRSASTAVAAMLATHRAAGTYRDCVDRYVALTDFARRKFIQGGLPENRIIVKPNFIDPDPGVGEHRGGFALFVGRLSDEKGIDVLLDAWSRRHRRHDTPLKIVGDGPLADSVREAACTEDPVEWIGRRTREEIARLMQEAAFLVVPSTWYENLPMVVLEAFATGLPVVASRLGALESIVEHGRIGLQFQAGDAGDLARTVEALAGDAERRRALGEQARREYERKYTAAAHLEQLMEIYRSLA